MTATKVRPEKVKKVEEFKEKTISSKIMIATDYRGMTVKEMNDLRDKLYEFKAEYRVFKNTLAAKALGEEYEEFKKLLGGPVAVVFSSQEVIRAAKVLIEHNNEFEKPKILGGLMDQKFIGEKMVQELAKLPSREELLAKVLAGMQAPIYGLVNVLQGNLRKLIYALNAVKNKKTQGGEK